MAVYILKIGLDVVGIYNTRTKARDVAQALLPREEVTVTRASMDYAVDEIRAGKTLFMVTFADVRDQDSVVIQPGLESLHDHGDITYSSASRRLSVAVFSMDEAAAAVDAEAIRLAFATTNGF